MKTEIVEGPVKMASTPMFHYKQQSNEEKNMWTFETREAAEAANVAVVYYAPADVDTDDEDVAPSRPYRTVTSVGVYEALRCRGGSEEGGWYYDLSVWKFSLPLLTPGDADEVEALKALLAERFDDNQDMTRGPVISVLAEHVEKQYHDTARPTYE